MIFITAIKTIKDLSLMSNQLSDLQYCTSCKNLSGATIGQHYRHIIELFECLLNGYDIALVNYDLRKRDKNIETSRMLAQQLLAGMAQHIQRPDKPMQTQVCFRADNEFEVISTTYYREVLYNIEHTIHHMALIRVGIGEISTIQLPASFGVAQSTLKYQAACAQ